MQSAIERYLKEKNYPLSIVRSREFDNSQEILHAKAISLRQQGKGKRPNKSQPLTSEEESSLWVKGQLGDFNGKVLTNVNFKNLTEQLGFRGRQEHYDAYVEDFVIRQQEDGSENKTAQLQRHQQFKIQSNSQSYPNEHHWFLLNASNSKVKGTRPWNS